MNKFQILIFSVVSFIYFVFYLDYLIITSIGLSFSFFIIIDFIERLGKEFPLRQLIVLLAVLQWIVGAKISYEFGKYHYKYFMYVDEIEYMNLVVPAAILFYLGLRLIKLPNLKERLDTLIESVEFNRNQLLKATNVLFVLGALAAVLDNILTSPSLAFVFYLMNLLVYVSMGYYFYIFRHRKTLFFVLILTISFINALSVGVFHNFLLIGVFLFAIYVDKKTSFFKKVIFLLLAIIVVNVIQVVKRDYRSAIWNSKASNKIEVFFQLVQEEYFVGSGSFSKIGKDTKDDEEGIENVTTRINQGWIISRVLDNVPRNQKFLNGETILDGISASLLPRFLFPNKTSGDDSKRVFEKVTGFKLLEGTSMGLSLIGEFYANFGFKGAWVAMLLYGVLISLIIKLIVVNVNYSPFIILWYVLLFFQVIKAETDFIKVLNHLIKAYVLFISLRFLFLALGFDLFPRLKNRTG